MKNISVLEAVSMADNRPSDDRLQQKKAVVVMYLLSHFFIYS